MCEYYRYENDPSRSESTEFFDQVLYGFFQMDLDRSQLLIEQLFSNCASFVYTPLDIAKGHRAEFVQHLNTMKDEYTMKMPSTFTCRNRQLIISGLGINFETFNKLHESTVDVLSFKGNYFLQF